MAETEKKPKIAAIHLLSSDRGVGPKAHYSLRAREDYAHFTEHEHEVEVVLRPPNPVPGRKHSYVHYKFHKASIYIEYVTE